MTRNVLELFNGVYGSESHLGSKVPSEPLRNYAVFRATFTPTSLEIDLESTPSSEPLTGHTAFGATYETTRPLKLLAVHTDLEATDPPCSHATLGATRPLEPHAGHRVVSFSAGYPLIWPPQRRRSRFTLELFSEVSNNADRSLSMLDQLFAAVSP